MDHQTVGQLERQLGQMLMGAVNRVTRLKAGDAFPTACLDFRPQPARRETARGERKIERERKDSNGSGYQPPWPGEKISNARVRGIACPVDLP
jgi:hypothetical protein